MNFGSLATMLPWGIVADRIGERAVIALGQTGTAAALVWAGNASSYGELVGALSVVGALGAGVNAASGRAVMAWFGEEERGFALGIRQMATPLGGAVAAVALPVLNQQISLRAAFYGLAVACFAAAVVGAILLRTRAGRRSLRARASVARSSRLADLHREHVLRGDADQPARLLRALPPRQQRRIHGSRRRSARRDAGPRRHSPHRRRPPVGSAANADRSVALGRARPGLDGGSDGGARRRAGRGSSSQPWSSPAPSACPGTACPSPRLRRLRGAPGVAPRSGCSRHSCRPGPSSRRSRSRRPSTMPPGASPSCSRR